MPLVPGSHIGPYEVVGSLGAGGMGEVYRARDQKLNRDVALKVLLESVVMDADRVARFRREAQVLASLNHPNIAHLYGFEEGGEAAFLVMELVEGPTLADRIAQGPIALEESLPIARQIAEAVEAAHELGIIHRDLKPANVKVRDDGVVKVLDFGLAKALDPGASSSGTAVNSPTLTARATQMGTILGTAAYMAPEQAKGRSVDRRADIWAFGVVLYEMLTAARCFKGEDISDTLAAVLRQDVDWSSLPATTPPRLRRLLERCLDRDVKNRLRDIGEARVEIAKIEAGAPDASVVLAASAVPAAPPARRTVVPWIVATTFAAALVASLVMWAPWTAAPSPQPLRLSIVPPVALPFTASNFERSMAISPQGTHVAYVSGNDGKLVVRATNSLEAEPLAGISGARQPVFSPDGKWIVFSQGTTELKKVSITGGPAVTVCKTGSPPRGATWDTDDTIVFATAATSTGLMAVSAGGGQEPRELTKVDATGDHIFPAALPGGRGVLFTIVAPLAENSQIAVLDLATGKQKTLIRGGSQAEYVEPDGAGRGYLVYGVSGTLRAVPFDLDTLEVRGDAAPVVDRVWMGQTGAPQFAVSRTGALIYMPGTFNADSLKRTLVWMDRKGQETPTKAPPRSYFSLRLSPNGTRVAAEIRESDTDIWVWHLRGETLTRLTLGSGADSFPVWSTDSQRIVYRSSRAGTRGQLFWQAADGTGQVEQLTTADHEHVPNSFAPDGKSLLISETGMEGTPDLHLFTMDTRQSAPLVRTPFVERNAEVSPDGRFVAYDSFESGRSEIYVAPFPDVNSGRWQVSTSGGTKPAWSSDGHELFYTVASLGSFGFGDLHVVAITTKPSFSRGNPVKLFSYWGNLGSGSGRAYDVSPDGKRFIVIKDESISHLQSKPGADQQPFVFVVNWVAELKAKLGVK